MVLRRSRCEGAPMPADRDDDTSLTLLERLQNDPADPQAWGLFVERYQPRIRRWCLAWGLQDSDADDVAQEVLVKLFAALRKFQYDPARSFRAWLKTVTQHAWSDFVAARRKDPGHNAGPIATDRRLGRGPVRPGAAARRRLRPRAARGRDASRQEAGQTGHLGRLPPHRGRRAFRRRGCRASSGSRWPTSSWPSTASRKCSRKKSRILKNEPS